MVSSIESALAAGEAGIGSSRARKRVLLVSYHFPPVGGAGVQRPVKFVKYLRRFGWDASVLMAENPSVPVIDESLLADVPADAVIERARTWEPSYALKTRVAARASNGGGPSAAARRLGFRLAHGAANIALQPDPQILWAPGAIAAGTRLLRRMPHDAILATAPAYSNFLVGAALKKRFGLPLVLDYRDEWDLSTEYLENGGRDWLSRAVSGVMQRAVLRSADAIVATTKASAQRLEERARAAMSRAEAECIYNGYDDSDFACRGVAKPREAGIFRVVYTGTLWNLTSVEPLVRAVDRLAACAPHLAARVELVFVGRRTPEQHAIVERIRANGCKLHVEDYCDHPEALAWMESADALCLLLSDVGGADRVAPAKLFEYLAARREIVAIMPDGEAAGVVRDLGAGVHFRPTDVEGIARWLGDRASGVRPSASPSPAVIAQFSRERLAGQLATVLDRVASWS